MLAKSPLCLRREFTSLVCFLKAFFSALVNLEAQDFMTLEVAILDFKFAKTAAF